MSALKDGKDEGACMAIANGAVARARAESSAKEGVYTIARRGKRVTESSFLTEAKGDGRWGITLIEAGWSGNGRYYSNEVLRRAVEMYEGAQSFDNHQSDAEYKAKPFRPISELLGIVENVRFVEDRGGTLVGDFVILEPWFADKLQRAAEANVIRQAIGLSHTILADQHSGEVNGRAGQIVKSIDRVLSVDVVASPAAGGAFDHPVAEAQEEVQEMEITQEELVKKIEAAVAAALKQMQKQKADDDEEAAKKKEAAAKAKKEADDAAAEKAKKEAEDAAKAKAATDPAKEAMEILGRIKAQQMQIAVEASQMVLARRLAESKLPQHFNDHIRKTFENRAFESGELDEFEKTMRALAAASMPGGNVTGHGAIKVTPQLTLETWQKMLDIAFNDQLHFDPAYKDIPHRRLSDIYVDLTGDVNYTGRFDASRAIEALATTSTMAELSRNALNKVLLKGYASRPRWWEQLCSPHSVDDLNQVRLIRTEAMGMAPLVAEGAAYTEYTWDDKSETADLAKYGGYLGITIEAIARDNVRGFARAAETMGQSIWKRVSYLAAYLFTQAAGLGPTLASDSTAWFDATAHANYNATGSALSYTSYGTARAALFAQVDSHGTAGEDELGFRPKFLLVPAELEQTAIELMSSDKRPDNADNGKNVYQNECTVVTVPNWTDVNDWVIMASPAEVEILAQLFFKGQREPELFQSADPTQGSMFTNDEIRYKIRYWTAIAVAGFRGIYKTTVA